MGYALQLPSASPPAFVFITSLGFQLPFSCVVDMGGEDGVWF